MARFNQILYIRAEIILRESLMTLDQIPFAVDLSNDGIFLWHRKHGRKWEFLGSVPLNSGNLRQQLDGLKEKSASIDALSLETIVRIPLAEVKTLTISPQPETVKGWEMLIVSELEKAANRSINELAFDFDRMAGTSDIQVAWTTVDVIKQAQTFVHLIGFEPTFYTTDLDPSLFPRNPNFLLVDNLATPKKEATPPVKSEPVTVDPIDPENPYPTFKDEIIIIDERKVRMGFMALFAVFLIVILTIAAVYLWQTNRLTSTGLSLQTSKPYIAVTEYLPQNSLKTVKQSYS